MEAVKNSCQTLLEVMMHAQLDYHGSTIPGGNPLYGAMPQSLVIRQLIDQLRYCLTSG